MAFSITLLTRIFDLRSNQSGDPDRAFVDECMRDFEHLKKDDGLYLSERRKCVKKISATDGPLYLKWLPQIRLTADERICDPEYLCDSGDSTCRDEGTPGTRGYRPGTISACYNLIDEARNEKLTATREQLNKEVDSKCIPKEGEEGPWKDYSEKVKIEYCMWKHRHTQGVCTNNIRTSCTSDGSCCPSGIQDDPSEPVAGLSEYECQKSPVFGLFCQHKSFVVEAKVMCKETTCPNFAWCRDFADIPNLCLGEACQDYRRTVAVCICSIALISFGLLCDLADVVVCMKWPNNSVHKTLLNVTASCFKFLVYLLCLSGGAVEFTNAIVAKQCFNAEGLVMAQRAKTGLRELLVCVMISAAGSLVLSPFSIKWGGKLLAVPYTRIRG